AAMTHGVMKLQGRPTLTRATHQTGRRLYVEMTFALVQGQAGGAARGAVAVARDVTERTEQQRADARRDRPGRWSSAHLQEGSGSRDGSSLPSCRGKSRP